MEYISDDLEKLKIINDISFNNYIQSKINIHTNEFINFNLENSRLSSQLINKYI